MLIRSEQLTLNEASDILDESVYLTEDETVLNPISVPVLENTRLGICTVNYNDIYRICEDYGCFSDEALEAVAESSGIDVDSIAVAIDEADIILDPNLAYEFPQYVVNPINENSMEYLLAESALELFLEGDSEGYLDTDYLDLLVENVDDLTYLNEIGNKMGLNSINMHKVNWKKNWNGETDWDSNKLSNNDKKNLNRNREMLKQKHDEIRKRLYFKALSKNLGSNQEMSDDDKKKIEQLQKERSIKLDGVTDNYERQKIMKDYGSQISSIKNKYKTSASSKKSALRVLTRYGNKFSNEKIPVKIYNAASDKYVDKTITKKELDAYKSGGSSFTTSGSKLMIAPPSTPEKQVNKNLTGKNEKQDLLFANADGGPRTQAGMPQPKPEPKPDTTPTKTPESIPPKVKEEIKKAENTNDPGRISKIVASLRNFYKNFLQRANQEHDTGKQAWYKNIARVILNYIDKLLAKLDKTKQA